MSDPLGAGIRAGTAAGTIVDDDSPNNPPEVAAGPDRVVPVGPADLDGTASDDGRPLPPALSVLWSQVSGPSPATFADATAVDTAVTLPAAGTYVFRLTASDGELSASDDVTLEARAGNQPPVASAGPDQFVLAPVATANLSGFASDDGLPEGSSLTVAWSLVSGPGAVTFGNPTAVATTVTLSAPGLYVLRLTAFDGELLRERRGSGDAGPFERPSDRVRGAGPGSVPARYAGGPSRHRVRRRRARRVDHGVDCGLGAARSRVRERRVSRDHRHVPGCRCLRAPAHGHGRRADSQR